MLPRSLFTGLVDDAALFPPGNAPMAQALAEHAVHRRAPYADLIGPFLCPASRIEEMCAALPPGAHLDLSIVFDVSGDQAHQSWRSAAADSRIRLVAVEAAHTQLGDDSATVGRNLKRVAGVTGFLEVPPTDFDDSLDLVAGSGWHAAKYRTGGVTLDAFPTELALATFLLAAVERDLPFKLTAGLHRAVRSTADETGFEHHGVLNVLVAARVAQQRADVTEVATVLAQRQPEPLVEFIRAWDERTCTDVRAAFRSFGCCGVTDPIDDLAALGLLGPTS